MNINNESHENKFEQIDSTEMSIELLVWHNALKSVPEATQLSDDGLVSVAEYIHRMRRRGIDRGMALRALAQANYFIRPDMKIEPTY